MEDATRMLVLVDLRTAFVIWLVGFVFRLPVFGVHCSACYIGLLEAFTHSFMYGLCAGAKEHIHIHSG